MTAKEMQYLFGIQMNQFDRPLELTSDDIQYWLNKAQIELVRNKFEGINQKREGFEQSQPIIDDLQVLLVKDEVIRTSYVGGLSSAIGAYHVDSAELPEEHMFLVSQRSLVKYYLPEIDWNVVDGSRTSSQGATISVANKYAQSDDVYKLLTDPFNTTKIASPLTDIASNKINVYTDKSFIVEDVIINYIKRPRDIHIDGNVDSELPEHLHKEIIQRAVDSFLNNTRNLKERLQRETPVADEQPIEQNE